MSIAVEGIYMDDADVMKDTELQNFFADVGDKAKGNLAPFRYS